MLVFATIPMPATMRKRSASDTGEVSYGGINITKVEHDDRYYNRTQSVACVCTHTTSNDCRHACHEGPDARRRWLCLEYSRPASRSRLNMLYQLKGILSESLLGEGSVRPVEDKRKV